LATYFRQAGYFVVRGVPFEYGGFSITDIDLWLYIRSSAVFREIVIVDIKNKKTPQAIERIFWLRGLQKAVFADRAIVVTNDSREAVASFGKKMGVTVLGGQFIRKLVGAESLNQNRFSEEELELHLKESTFGKLDGDWKGRINFSKQQLAQGISFNSINLWLEQGYFFAQQVLTRPTNRQLAFRLLLRLISYIAVGVDYVLKDLSFDETAQKRLALKSGFTYGSGGVREISESIDNAISMLKQFSEVGAGEISNIKTKIQRAFEQLPTEILSEFFSSVVVARGLVNVAKELDEISMTKSDPFSAEFSLSAKSLMGCLLDFWGIDRRGFGLTKLNDQALQATPSAVTDA